MIAALLAAPGWALATMVRIDTVKGPIDIHLYDEATPLTVANFLSYVHSGAYNNSFFHRLASGFVLQGGGYTFPPLTPVVKGAAVQNEFSATRSNLRGTVAMAKLGGNANSATSEWFVNLGNNSANLDKQNGGFTVFGKVTLPSLGVVDGIAALQIINAGGAFDTLPVVSLPVSGPLVRENLAMVNTARELPTTAASDTDRVLNYLEAAYPQYVQPASPATLTAGGYLYRYYAKSNAYVGTKDGNVYYLVPAISNDVTLMGTLADWLTTATANGY
ncbi:peptidylprolyl isomerase [Candidatus Accumulibacter aalborgensis]|uniref:peptidylprolyl isomerase n=1 Tax=Candidatus Accumulibacter aalborgensis TaxID=1860102 RepID=UPI001FE12753|nr:peptidylprolyl isomerase [Candidatus Accumulibacter aalborgensis]